LAERLVRFLPYHKVVTVPFYCLGNSFTIDALPFGWAKVADVSV
jgi:hypothetical protein